MKTKILTLLFCILSLTSLADNIIINEADRNKDYKFIKKRTIDANFSLNNGGKLNLNTLYSDIKISNWNERHICFHIEIMAKANTESRVNETLHAIDVDFEESKLDNTLDIKTIFSKNNFSNTGFNIVFYIMIPNDLTLSISNTYGSININKLYNIMNLDMKYGDLVIDSIISKCDLNLLYSDANIKHASKLTGRATYSELNINNIDESEIILTYSSADIGNVDNIDIRNTYSDVDINNLNHELICKSTYGDLNIDNINKNFKLIDISGCYCDIELNLTEFHNFSYDIRLTYGDYDGQILKKHASKIVLLDHTTTLYGNINDPEEEHKVRVKTTYGDLEIND